jgi:hypothetical protein
MHRGAGDRHDDPMRTGGGGDWSDSVVVSTAILPAALATSGATLVLLRAGSRHPPASARFAGLP